MDTSFIKGPRVGAPQNDIHDAVRGVAATARPAAPAQDAWEAVKTLLEIGFAVVRVVELAILFA